MDPPCLKFHLDTWRVYLANLGIWTVDYSHSCLLDRCDRMEGFIVRQPRCGSPACTVELWGCLKSGQHHICTNQAECRHILSSEQIIGRSQDDESNGGERCRDAADLHLQYICLFSRRVVGSEFAPDDYRAETDVGSNQRAILFSLERGEFGDYFGHHSTDTPDGAPEDGEDGGGGSGGASSSQADATRIAVGHANRSRKRRARSPPESGTSASKRASVAAAEKRLTIAERLDAQTRRKTTQLLVGSTRPSHEEHLPSPAAAAATWKDADKVHQFIAAAEGKARAAPNTLDRRRSTHPSSVASIRERKDREQRIRESRIHRIRTAMRDPMVRRHVWMTYLPHPLQHRASNVMEYSSTWPSDTVGADYSIVENVHVRETNIDTMRRIVEGDPTLAFHFESLPSVKHDVFKASVDWTIIRPPTEEIRTSFARVALEKQMGRRSNVAASAANGVTFEDPTWPVYVRQSCKAKIQTTINWVCCDYYWQEQRLPSVTAVIQSHLARIVASIASPAVGSVDPAGAGSGNGGPADGTTPLGGITAQDHIVITESHSDVAVVMSHSRKLAAGPSPPPPPPPPPPPSYVPAPRLTVTRESVRKCTKWLKWDVENTYSTDTWLRDTLISQAAEHASSPSSAKCALRLYAILLESGIYATTEFARVLDGEGLPNENMSVLGALISGMARAHPRTSSFVAHTVDIISRKLHPSVLAEVLSG